jgi:hypothetical protein
MNHQAEGEGFEPTMRLSPHTCFQDRRLKPLGHPSMDWRVKFYHIYLIDLFPQHITLKGFRLRVKGINQ